MILTGESVLVLSNVITGNIAQEGICFRIVIKVRQ